MSVLPMNHMKVTSYWMPTRIINISQAQLSLTGRTEVFRNPVCSREQSLQDSAEAFESWSLHGERSPQLDFTRSVHFLEWAQCLSAGLLHADVFGTRPPERADGHVKRQLSLMNLPSCVPAGAAGDEDRRRHRLRGRLTIPDGADGDQWSPQRGADGGGSRADWQGCER